MSKHKISLDGCYTIEASGVLTKLVSNEMVIVDMRRGIYHGLNTVGVYIWEELKNKPILRQVANDLTELYADVDREIIEADMLKLVQELLDNDLVVPC
jgi:hypothetical protein